MPGGAGIVLWAAAGLTAAVGAAAASADRATDRPPIDVASPSTPRRSPTREELQAVEAIRRALGGSAVDDVFPPATHTSRDPSESAGKKRTGVFQERGPGRELLSPQDEGGGPRLTSPQIAALRKGAESLDAAAARLEEAELYVAADEVRESAGRLRRWARRGTAEGVSSALVAPTDSQ